VQRWSGRSRWTRLKKEERLDGKRTAKRNQAAAQTEKIATAGQDQGVAQKDPEKAVLNVHKEYVAAFLEKRQPNFKKAQA
jgi:hypothetical protein